MKNLMRLLGRKKVWEDEKKCEECQWKARKYEIESCEFKKSKEFLTRDFNWLKTV